MKRGIFLLLLILALALIGTWTLGMWTQGPTNWQKATIIMKRDCYFLSCPLYQVTIHGDGRIKYEGWGHTDFTGTRQGTVELSEVRDLVAAFDTANFWTLWEFYLAPITDQPRTVTTLQAEGREKQVSRDKGSNAPPSLISLEDQIDSIVAKTQWTR